MMRHALVVNTETRERAYAPYNGDKSDKRFTAGGTMIEQVAEWCAEQNLEGPLMIIESGGGKPMRTRLY